MGPGAVGFVGVEVGVGLEEGGDDVFVFVALDGAGRIDEAAAGFQDFGGVVEELFLHNSEVLDVVVFETPANFRVASKRYGAGARGVDEDSIE